MEEVKDVKLVNTETGEVLIEFDTLKVSDIAEEEEKNEEISQALHTKHSVFIINLVYGLYMWVINFYHEVCARVYSNHSINPYIGNYSKCSDLGGYPQCHSDII